MTIIHLGPDDRFPTGEAHVIAEKNTIVFALQDHAREKSLVLNLTRIEALALSQALIGEAIRCDRHMTPTAGDDQT